MSSKDTSSSSQERRGLFRRILGVLPWLWGTWISLIGTTLATVAGNFILIVAVVDLATGGVNEYLATFAFLGMPLVFIFGLLLIALGAWRDRKKRKTRPHSALDRALDTIAQDRKARRQVTFVVVATLVNVTLITLAAFKGVTYMDSTEFCGELCHSVMKPEYYTYQRSPHARVACVSCHIGPGASWFVRSKLSGLRQVWATLTDDFSRPIPTPIHNLRPAPETCEQCHWPAKFHGSRMMVSYTFKSDEKNTRQVDVVRLKIGGINKGTNRFIGIHWHVAPDVRIEYEALDRDRAVIGQVTMTVRGKTTVFVPEDEERRKAKVVERRVMDCVDCHNRPTHIYAASPEAAIDQALSYKRIDPALPFVRKRGLALLEREIKDTARADQIFTEELERYYQESYPEVAKEKAKAIAAAGQALGEIYFANIWPDLNIDWGTYPSHLGHERTEVGCFRCHDYEHVAEGDRYIGQDCSSCHEVLAQEEVNPDVPEEILELGRL